MSPITIQAARLASRQALRAPALQQQQMMFRRYASTHQAGDWGRIMKSRASCLLIFFPGMGLALGWPLIASKIMGA
ncbi:hypothetical protein F4808DRAFT_295694 [Astrocystis sublimbata]|nr:hypothetical protein F4808DRAFT_295694 [Astrocystis sublimbata]